MFFFSFCFLCASSLLPFPSPSPHGDRIPGGTSERADLAYIYTEGQATSLLSPLHKTLFRALIAPLQKALTRDEPRRFPDLPVRMCVCVCLRQLLVLPFIDTSALGDVFTKATFFAGHAGRGDGGGRAGRWTGGRREVLRFGTRNWAGSVSASPRAVVRLGWLWGKRLGGS